MLLRPTVPLVETLSANATHHRPRLSLFILASLKHSKRTYAQAEPRSPLKVLPKLRPGASSSSNDRFSGRKRKLLTPFELSGRVEALCKDGNLSKAVSIVKEAPLDAQNSIVWATLIRSVIGKEKYQEAYRLFIDMKRRGIRPTSRTFSTLLKGYSRISDWERLPLQLENLNSIFDQLKEHNRQAQITGESEANELSNIPYNLLIGIFGNAQRFQRMFDVFNAMPSKGPLAPDIHTFTTLITAIGNRQLTAYSHTSAIDGGDESGVPVPTADELAHKNASDAKLIWRQLLRACETPDSHSIRAIIRPLSRGRPSDQDFAFDIIHQYLGLSRPGEPSIPAKIKLHEQTLHAVLMSCIVTKRYRYTLHYVQQVIDSRQALLLDTKHMDLAMQAHVSLAYTDRAEPEKALEKLQWMLRMQALPQVYLDDSGIGPKIRPGTNTYELVVLACQNGGDWPNACRAFELMTGYARDQFRGGEMEMRYSLTRGVGQGLRPSARFMTSFIKCAAKTADLENVRLALNVLEFYGVDAILAGVLKHGELDRKVSLNGGDSDSKQLLYASRLAEALRTVLPQMFESGDYDEAMKSRWKNMLRRADKT